MNLEGLRGRVGRRIRRPERGASAIVVALLMTVIMAAGAIGLDISKLVFERQQVRAAVDAAAQIGAAKLSPSALGTTAANDLVAVIKNAAVANYGSSTYGPGLTSGTVTVAFYCVVSNLSGSSATVSPNTAQIPSTCKPNPVSTDYTTGTKCGAASCAIPCYPTSVAAAVCNAVQVSAVKEVKYMLAPAINIDHGYASASTVSCQGSCGGDAPPNPMDVVLMADRTPSMTSQQLADMRTGIKNMLGFMNQDQQYVAFGALSISGTTTSTSGSERIKAASSSGQAFTTSDYATYSSGKTTWDSQGKLWQLNGSWVPISYTNKYQKTVSGATQIDLTSQLGNAVDKLATSSPADYPSPWHTKTTGSTWTNAGCKDWDWKFRKNCDTYGQVEPGAYNNTQLASALKAAVQYSLYTDPIADLSLPTRTQYGTPKKVVIFETDGNPSETFNSSDTALSLDETNKYDIGATDDAGPWPVGPPQKACDNFTKIADLAKADAKKLTLIMIAVGDAVKPATKCGTKSVAEMLASAASKDAEGHDSAATSTACDTETHRTAENADGDNFFCASDANELKSVFTAAMGNITGGTKFLAIDGVGD